MIGTIFGQLFANTDVPAIGTERTMDFIEHRGQRDRPLAARGEPLAMLIIVMPATAT